MSITIQGLNVTLSRNHILKNISFSTAPAGITAILGPNGSGKTTLLRSINKAITPDSGMISIHSTPIEGMTNRKLAKSIAYVPQRAHTCFISVFDAVLLGRVPHIKYKASPKDTTLTIDVIEKLGLTDQMLQPLSELSGGELQKVAIARALVQKTPLIILDEPTAALDVRNQIEILSLLSQVSRDEGIKVLLTIHDLNTALRYADEFVFLRSGRVTAVLDRSEVTSQIIEDVYDIPVDILWKHNIPMVIPTHKELGL